MQGPGRMVAAGGRPAARRREPGGRFRHWAVMTIMAETSFTPRTRPWLSDFTWRDGRVEVRKTGVRLALDYHLVAEIASWAVYLAMLWTVAAVARLRRRRPLALWYAPDRPRPWYMIRGAALWAGIGLARSPAAADAAFYFDDVTRGLAPPPGLPRALNFACTDVSKSHVARVFEEVFGYPLALDPATASGPIVEKSEKNGVHDGRVVIAPLQPRPGYVYQRLVDTADDAGSARDLRTPCAGGEPVVVWIKLKPAAARFAIHNRRAVLRRPDEVFSPGELALIRRFNARMGADWGGLDILRDRHDGRIYIVDVNKTDVGPVIALSWVDKARSMSRLARALERLVAGD
jgi:hypothetical protein